MIVDQLIDEYPRDEPCPSAHKQRQSGATNSLVCAFIGIVQYSEDGQTPEALLGAADQSMYHNKRERLMAHLIAKNKK